MMRRIRNGQKGAVIITFAILLSVLLGFVALGMEVGRWYLVRAELSKGVDAAAFSGAINISNPHVSAEVISQEIGKENFSTAGYLGTEAGSVSFTPVVDTENKKVTVTGRANALAILARVFGINLVPVISTGVARLNQVEIMMVLDKSGSMVGQPMIDLKTAASSFLQFFEKTQDTDNPDKMGLITFATGVSIDNSLSDKFVAPITASINAMNALGAEKGFTNIEYALEQGSASFPSPSESGVKRFVVFFTDGNPDAFKATFTIPWYKGGAPFDAVTFCTSINYDPPRPGTCDGYIGMYSSAKNYRYLCKPDPPNEGSNLGTNMVTFPETSLCKSSCTGDGKPASTSACGQQTTKWHIFSTYPVPGYGPEDCNIPENALRSTNPNDPNNWFRNTARQMAINHAQEIKDRQIKIYVIGLGNVDADFLKTIASGDEFYYPAPTSDQLQAIFIKVAKEIRLQLVE